MFQTNRALLQATPSIAGLNVWVGGGIFMLAISAYTVVTLIFPTPF